MADSFAATGNDSGEPWWSATPFMPYSTGLPYPIWVLAKAEADHACRIGIEIASKRMVWVTIPDRVFRGDAARDISISGRQLIGCFIDVNLQAILMHWYGDIDSAEVARRLVPIRGNQADP